MKYRILFICIVLIMIAGCGVGNTPQPTNNSATDDPISQSISNSAPNPTTVVQATPQPTSIANGILYIDYEYFELEGVPPVPSTFVSIQRHDETWVDTLDPNRSRQERHYQTQENPPRQGLESVYVGTGLNGVLKLCDMVEGQQQCSDQSITNTLTLDQWLQQWTQMGQRMLANKATPSQNQDFTYQGIQHHAQWGDVHVFEKATTITTGEHYLNQPAVVTLMFDTQQLRRVEQKMTLTKTNTMYMSNTLKTWQILDPATLPNDLFDPNRDPVSAFDK